LQFIFPLLDKNGKYIEILCPELLELINDHDSFVKIDALETFTKTLLCFTE
jgi:hypothetical protein